MPMPRRKAGHSFLVMATASCPGRAQRDPGPSSFYEEAGSWIVARKRSLVRDTWCYAGAIAARRFRLM